uniref:Secreted protein n=1 Tax=Arundo donax TaxID=35708 RepID=A0A0A9H7S9_ARUDO
MICSLLINIALSKLPLQYVCCAWCRFISPSHGQTACTMFHLIKKFNDTSQNLKKEVFTAISSNLLIS